MMEQNDKRYKKRKFFRSLPAACLTAVLLCTVFLCTACGSGSSANGQSGGGTLDKEQSGSGVSGNGQSGDGHGGASVQTEGSIKLGMTLSDQYDAYIIKLVNAINASVSAKEKETGTDINLEIYNAAGIQETQNSQILSMIDKNCDVICVNPVEADAAALSEVMEAAEKAQIPLIFFDVPQGLASRLSGTGSDNFYYVGNDPTTAGIQAGDLALELLRKSGQADKDQDGCIACVTLITEDVEMDGWNPAAAGEAGHLAAAQGMGNAHAGQETGNTAVSQNGETQNAGNNQYQGTDTIELYLSPMDAALAVCSTWEAYPVLNLGSLNAGGSRKQAEMMMEQQMSGSGNQIELILAGTDEMALGAADALKAAGVTADNWPVIVGIGGTEVGLEGVRSGQISGTIYRDKEGEADALTALAYKLAAEAESAEYVTLVKGVLITEDNAGNYSGY